MTEKDKEGEHLKQKYSELENQFNKVKNENNYYIEHFDNIVTKAIKDKVSRLPVKENRRSKDCKIK